MNSEENLTEPRNSDMKKENNVTTLNSEKKFDATTYTNEFTQNIEKTNSLENFQESAGPSRNNIRHTMPSAITQFFHVLLEEEKYMNQFGEGRQEKFYLDIMQTTGVKLQSTFVKKQGLYITISGNAENITTAQKKIFQWFQKQGLTIVSIHKDHHGFVIGNTGGKLQDLEQNDAINCQISCPGNNSNHTNTIDAKKARKKAPQKALHISAEQNKCVVERLHVENIFQPFTGRPYNKVIDNVTPKTKTHVHIPLPSDNQTKVAFPEGNKQPEQTEACVKNIFEKTERETMTTDKPMKSEHQSTIDSKNNFVQESPERSGEVSREISPLEGPSDSVTHPSEPESLEEAFTEVHRKAKGNAISFISAPSWLHRFIIGKKGQNISKITHNRPKVRIEFTGEDKITLKGPTEDVNYAREQIEIIIEDLVNKMDYAEISIDYKFHRYLIGKDGTIINRIKEKNKVSIHILPENEKNNLIRIEGESSGVQEAKRELLELAANLGNEHTKDLIIEQRFHRAIIGRKGERIHDIRKKFPDVMINFPDPAQKSDIVQLRGPKHELEKCTEYLENVVADVVQNSYSVTIPVFKKLHKNIIGKGGANIKTICSASNTKINLPSASSNSENIVISGKPENCELACKWIFSIQKNIANISEVEISIPSDLHKSLTDPKDCLISSLMKECGNIHIHFPKTSSDLPRVIIRGPAQSVEMARKKLLKLAEESQAKSYAVTLHVKPQYHQFLMSKNGGNVPKICDKTGVHVIFPNTKERDQELLTITGAKESVEVAQKELEALIKNLDNEVEENMLVNSRYHHYFTMRRGQVLQEMTKEYGGVIINFSCSGKPSNKVTIKGAKPCVDATKKRIQEIIKDLDTQITTECVIPQKFHRFVMGPMCTRIQQIARDYNVQIKFPDREENRTTNIKPTVWENRKEIGEKSTKEPASISPPKCDIVSISGRKEKCEAAMEALKALIPITAEVVVPFGLHRYIIGQKGSEIRKIIEEFDVNIQVSVPGLESDIIAITGTAPNVEKAKTRLQERVKALQTEIQDRALRNFKLKFTVDPKYHPKIIGRRGLIISQICLEHDVIIHFPSKNNNEIQDQITITGYEDNTLRARDAIMKMVHQFEKTVTRQISLNHCVHSHIIGFHGKNIHKIMNQFQENICFPPKGSSNQNAVTVSGLPDKVKRAVDHIHNLEEHYLSVVTKYESEEKAESDPVGNVSSDPSNSFADNDIPCTTNTFQKAEDVSNSKDFSSSENPESSKTHLMEHKQQ
ncbi:Vigilin [Tupaia chinensis]|uniref:Vigilin n=1 Tax=Tupaia chinensis TaxID=246437 RepID=L8Y3G5_TUPCH|nr:Vigilin [Tupaia chinensis]